MARKKNLAGLAALAGLAYVASRDKAQKGLAPVVDAPAAVKRTDEAAPAVTEPTKQVDPYEVRDDDGTLSTLRRNEYGELYNPTGSTSTATASAPASVSKPAATRSIAPPRTARPTAADSDFNMNYSNEGRDRHRARPTVPGSELKKGGSVKGWGMARGARKAKTY
jgi:hypothetical protein